MRRLTGHDDGLTVYQLLVTIVVIVIAGSLWMAFSKHQSIKQQQQSCLPEVRRG
jgi:heme/copper-type cytochrome/quinol oxidase subunit 4